ncbi:centrosomal protein 43-like [Polistes fuscatus]|uniref:centrosomal protein 43-like n=1 Tax=Polistes fuscatus TaxID=30207 RepID=UPI001CA8B704|nr:centrosomal protein 43-like [Polistes fuscatus]
MIDSNISMEEDTELRDLVVQTLENNGVLAKVRAELRASVFLALEEQESVMNPEPLLNKTVKQYLANSEGKLLFSLVREFLEYFGLDYTISVYDPETYIGKEYNYVGRNKLCEELGINSSEPLLGEILKNSMNICNITQKVESNDSRHNKTNETSTNFANATFEVPVPKILHTESLSNDNDSSEKLGSFSEQSTSIPINVTITDKKKTMQTLHNDLLGESHDKEQNSLRENIIVFDNVTDKDDGINDKGNNIHSDKSPIKRNDTYEVINHTLKETATIAPGQTDMFNKEGPFITFDESIVSEMQQNQNVDVTKQNSINNKELHIMNNVQNKKEINIECNFGKAIYFEEIIVDEKRDNVGTVHKAESSSPLDKSGSIFDLPPLNGKKTNINDIKELMDVGLALDNVDNYEEDFVSSASGSFNEQSPSKELQELDNSLQAHVKKEDTIQSTRSEDISEEIEETDEILSSTSCLQGVNINEKDEKVSHFTTGITTNYSNEI